MKLDDLASQTIPDNQTISPHIDDINSISHANSKYTSQENFNCIYCGGDFESKIGLTQHKRHRHPEEYTQEIQLTVTQSRNTIWSDEEIYLIARIERFLLQSKETQVRNMNQ